MLRRMACFSLLLIVFSTFSSCYHMPTEDDYSLVPLTNNPDITRQRDDPLTPRVQY